jgi:phosphoribosylformylglycinamidine (FGAM) synthase-like amidotransferase family enzyme
VAHGEGQFTLSEPSLLTTLQAQDQLAFCYSNSDGKLAGGQYPSNPNGSIADIAGICNPQGNVLGLMPHPEDHVLNRQHPCWTRGEQGRLGLQLFESGVKYVK